MHVHHLRVQKWAKLGKKGVFFAKLTNFGKDMTDKLRKNVCKNAYLGLLGSIFISEKYMFRVCFENPFTNTRMISSLEYKCPPTPIECESVSATDLYGNRGLDSRTHPPSKRKSQRCGKVYLPLFWWWVPGMSAVQNKDFFYFEILTIVSITCHCARPSLHVGEIRESWATRSRALASLTVPGGQEFHIPHFS